MMQTYAEYKDSGVDWLGEIPAGWGIQKVTHLFPNIGSGTTPATGNPKYYDGKIPWLQTGDLTDGSIVTTKKTISKLALKIHSTLKIYNAGSLVIAMYGATVGKLGLLSIETTTNQACCVLEDTKTSNMKFVFYLFYGFRNNIINLAYGGGQPNISQDVIRNLRFPLPPLPEQTAIANFLDDKTAKIDELVGIKRRQIALLGERKQILIQNAVTKGLNPAAPMKDSGVDWIGKIPAHWEVKPGLVALSENKRNNKGMKRERVLSLSYGKIIVKPKEKLVGLVPESFETYQLIDEGDIIIRGTDLQNDKKSLRTGLANNDGIITNAYLSLRVSKRFLPRYMHLYLHSLDVSKVLYRLGSGLRQNLSFDDFKRLSVIKVPKDEQQEIVDFVHAQEQKINTAIAIKQNQITKLNEYKTTLINAAVTGKIKVV